MNIESVVLLGKTVRLEPMESNHIDELFEVGKDPALWEWTNNFIRERGDMESYVAVALSDRERGVAVPFVTVDPATGRLIGSTRFGNIEVAHRKAEIGWTWVAPPWQRSAANTEAKLLMLTHAFETWNCARVELKTDTNNQKSRNAIARIGGVEEGILRNHMITDSGRFRDSVYFSIIEGEWPEAKKRLTAMLSR